MLTFLLNQTSQIRNSPPLKRLHTNDKNKRSIVVTIIIIYDNAALIHEKKLKKGKEEQGENDTDSSVSLHKFGFN